MKSKETSSQLNSYVAIMHRPVTASSNMYPNTCVIKASAFSTPMRSNIIPTVAEVITYIFYFGQSRN